MCQLTAILPCRDLQPYEQAIARYVMADLLFENGKGGNRDGTGIANYDHLSKWEESAGKVIAQPDFKSDLKEIVGCGLPVIGHVRATSTGRNAKEGAHPFTAGHLVLAHNGTFRGFKDLDAFKTFDKDDDPVDSHVVTRELAARLGDKAFDLKTLNGVLKDADGSFAMLVLDCKERKTWIIRGGLSLYQAKVGPFLVINTTRQNLIDTLLRLRRFLTYYSETKISMETPETVEARTANIFEGGELVKVGDIPSFPTISRYGGTTSGRVTSLATRGTTDHTDIIKDEEGKKIVSSILDMMSDRNVPLYHYRRWTRMVLEKTWYELSLEETIAFCKAVKQLYDLNYTPRKRVFWDDISAVLYQNELFDSPYKSLHSLGFTIHVPYFLEPELELKRMLDELVACSEIPLEQGLLWSGEEETEVITVEAVEKVETVNDVMEQSE